MSEQLNEQKQEVNADEEILVYQKSTWGSYGQHSNRYTFVINLETLQQDIISNLIETRYENNDSRKNLHRYAYAKLSDIAKLRNCIIKIVDDYASSSKRRITVTYYDNLMNKLNCSCGLKDSRGFYDKVILPNGKILKVRKDSVEVVEQ